MQESLTEVGEPLDSTSTRELKKDESQTLQGSWTSSDTRNPAPRVSTPSQKTRPDKGPSLNSPVEKSQGTRPLTIGSGNPVSVTVDLVFTVSDSRTMNDPRRNPQTHVTTTEMDVSDL